MAVRDSMRFLDFLERHFSPEESQPTSSEIADFIISNFKFYSEKHFEKFVGVAMPVPVAEYCPTLCSRLWQELDIAPLALHEREGGLTGGSNETSWGEKSLDELAESLARRCIRSAPAHQMTRARC